MQQGPTSPVRRLLDPTVGLFVSLYFILLAFFIVMNAVSNQDTARKVAVLESLENAFERPFPVPASSPGLVPPASHVAADSRFLLRSGELVSALLGPARHLPSEGGNRLVLALPAHALFYAGDIRLSEQAAQFFEAMAKLISEAGPGERREMAILFGQRGAEGELAWRRADALARAMIASTIPGHAIAVGLDARAPGLEIAIQFRIEEENALKLDFATTDEGAT